MEGVFAIFLEWLSCTYMAINLYAFLQTLKNGNFFVRFRTFFDKWGILYVRVSVRIRQNL